MSNRLNYSELIDAHLTGQLSPEESTQLMQLLEQDPSLKEEFNLQRDMVNAIREQRRMQLKSRLDNIELGTGSGYTLPSAGALKMVAGAALLVLLGGGSWFAYQQLQPAHDAEQLETISSIEPDQESLSPTVTTTELTKITQQPSATQPEEESVAPEEDTNEKDAPYIAETSPADKPAASEEFHQPNRTDNKPAEGSQPVDAAQKDESIITRPEIVKPEVLTFFDEPDAVDSVPEANTPKDKLNEAHSFSTQNIEVTTKTDKQYPFHYMFHDNQLHIYGDFSQVPYEVLEVNTGTYTLYYLYHGGNYYELNPNQRKITRLKELKNEKIMQELEITRTQKLKH